MKKLSINGLVSAAVLAGALGMASTTATAGWSANVGMVTDYRFRGVSQNDENFAIQGGFDYAFDNGFYVGTWASSLDWQDQVSGTNGNNTNIEIDLYGGYGGEFSNGLGYDVGVLRYMYPGQSDGPGVVDYDTTEVYGSLSYGIFSASLAYSPELNFLAADDATYVNLAVDYEFDNGVGIGASYGVSDINVKGAPDLDYDDWKVYVAKSFGGFDFELSYVDTDISGGCGSSAAPFQCDGTAILAVSKSFE